MQDLVLVGAGGLTLEIYDYILNEDQPCRVKGFISDYNFEKFMLVHPTIPHLGKIVDYQIKENEQLVICIGDARARKK